MDDLDRLISEVVGAECGCPPVRYTRLAEGFSNDVYAVDAVDGQQVIVRIHRGADPHFESERWALARAAELGLPAPRVLLLTHTRLGEVPSSVCVESRLPGRTLRAALSDRALSSDELRRVLVALGRFLARLHAAPTTGVGRIDATGAAPEPSWESDLQRACRGEAFQAARNLGIAASLVDEAVDLLRGAIGLRAGLSPRLLHGDVTPQNVMVDGGRFQGMIDFEFPGSGDPAMDVAVWDYYRHSPFHNPTGAALPTEWIVEGYRDQVPPDPSFAARLVGCRLRFGLDLLSYHGVRDDQDPRFLDLIRASFVRDLEAMRRLMG